MSERYQWYPFGTRNPYITDLKSHDGNTIVFDGYFYVDANDLPVQRVMERYSEPVTDLSGNTYCSLISASHIEIYEKISGEDTSFPDVSGNDCVNDCGDDDDDFGGRICFFPTEITTLKYRVLKSDLTVIERDMLVAVIKENEKERERRLIETMLSDDNTVAD